MPKERDEMRKRLRNPYVGLVVGFVGFTVGGITLFSGRRSLHRSF
jgi:hypothetical protein